MPGRLPLTDSIVTVPASSTARRRARAESPVLVAALHLVDRGELILRVAGEDHEAATSAPTAVSVTGMKKSSAYFAS